MMDFRALRFAARLTALIVYQYCLYQSGESTFCEILKSSS